VEVNDGISCFEVTEVIFIKAGKLSILEYSFAIYIFKKYKAADTKSIPGQ